MSEIKISEENFKKAHAEGCSDVKRVLETLAPDLFVEPIKYPCFGKYLDGEVVLFTERHKGVSVIQGDLSRVLGYESHTWGDNWTPIKGIKEIE